MASSKTKTAFLLSLSQNVNLVLSIVSTAILSRLFSPIDLGIYKQTLMVFDILQPFFLLCIPEALYFFLPGENKDKYMFNTFILVTLSGIFVFISLYFGRSLFASQFNNTALLDTLRIYSIFALFYFPIQIVNPILIYYEESVKMSIWACLSNCIMLGAIIITAFLNCSYELILTVRVIIQTLICLFSIIWIVKMIKPDFSEYKIDLPCIVSILKYALPLGLASLMGALCMRVDKFMVSMYVTPDEYAIYSNGAMEVPFINSITGSISAVIIIEYVELYRNGEYTKIIDLFKKCAFKTSLFLFPIMIYFSFWNREFIVVLYSEQYIQSAQLFFIYLFTIPIRIVQYGPVMQAMNKNFLIVIRSVGDLLVNILLNFVFIRLFGMQGAAIATVTVLYLWTVPFNMFVISKGLSTGFFSLFPWKKLVKNIIISVIIVLISQFVKLINISDLVKLIISTLFCVLLYIPYLFYIDKDTVLSLVHILKRDK